MGNRIQKRLYSQGDDRPPVITRYVRDVGSPEVFGTGNPAQCGTQGNTMAVYTETYEGQDARQVQNEAHLYGASRLGIKKANVEYTQSFNGNYINDRFDNLTIGWSASFEYCPATYSQTDPESKVANAYNRQLGDKVYELSNHLGNVQVTISDGKYTDQSHSENWMPTIASFTDYYPFGMVIVERTWSMDEYRYGFNGKENDDEVKGSGNSVDFGARIYDSRLGRWLSVDPFFSKYLDFSPYNYCLNSINMCKDDDGKEVKFVNMVDIDNRGQFVPVWGAVSAKTNELLTDFVKTPEGLDYISQFAKKGQIIGGHLFSEDGKFSDQDLIFQDFSLEQYNFESAVPIVQLGTFIPRISADGKKVEVYIQLMSFNQNKFELGITLAHEIALHGYKAKYLIKAFKESGVIGFKNEENKKRKSDHQALKEKDTNHEGFRRYIKLVKQFAELNKKYEEAYKADEKDAGARR